MSTSTGTGSSPASTPASRRLLLASFTLDPAGVPTYTRTLYRELVRRGHDVTVFSPRGGSLEVGMNTVHGLGGLEPPDVIFAQHNRCAYALREAFPYVPMVYCAHGNWVEIEQPPRGIEVQAWVAVNERVRDNLVRQYVPEEDISIIRDFVDTDVFTPVEPLQEKRPRVLFVSNYKKWRTFDILEAACRRTGMTLTAIGAQYGRRRPVEEAMNAADIVVGWGRCVIEGLACGRAVISYNKLLGDGYLTRGRYFESRERNFGEYECRFRFTADELAGELLRYNPADGAENRDLALRYHDAIGGVNQVLRVVEGVL